MGLESNAAQRWRYEQGMNGVPYRTRQEATPSYKNGDPEFMRPKTVADMKVKTFDLSDDKQREEMEKALDLCAKGRGYVSRLETQYDAGSGSYRALVIWGVYFLEDPREEHHNATEDQQHFS
jgi:hypothetical protein